MSGKQPDVGSIGWIDLTVADADRIRDFYEDVVGWKASSVDMGEYSDYNMNLPATGTPAAGVCNARGTNAELPSQWMIYITVGDLDRSMTRCVERGGKVRMGPKSIGSQGRYCVIEDPAGAVAALFEPA